MKIEMNAHEAALQKSFSDPAAVAKYSQMARNLVPGLDTMYQMTGLLLAERAPADARILVLGAGGGLEIQALASAYPGWTFVGVDPASEMLHLAKQTLGVNLDRVEWIEGYIDAAPPGPFDGAMCLLTLHFLAPEDRERTLRAMRDRLRLGATLITAHLSFPQSLADRDRWLDRYAAYAVSSGMDHDSVQRTRAFVAAGLNCTSPTDDEAILARVGFENVELFHVALAWRGWVSQTKP